MKQTVNWHDFWSKSGNPGFHENRVNRYLEEFLPEFDLDPGDTVFVPLCGKAVDMLWLAQQGFNVIGVELSEVAVKSFFAEPGLQYTVDEEEHFKVYSCANIRLYQGNFIHLTGSHVAACRLVYDRAAIVAIEKANRPLYVEHMMNILPPSTAMMVVCLQYDQAAMQGPPFSVPLEEVAELYQQHYEVDMLVQLEKIEEEPRWRERGLQSFVESAIKLNPKS